MPSAQVIDLSPMPRTETTNLEKTLSAFSQRQRENQVQQRESDALSDIYKEYQQDGQNLEKTIFDIQSRPGISPTTRVNTIKQLMEFREHNTKLQEKVRKDQEEVRTKTEAVNSLKKAGATDEQIALYNAAPVGGQTEIIKSVVETNARKQTPVGLKSPDIVDYDTGLTPKERVKRQDARFSTQTPLVAKNNEMLRGLEAQDLSLDLLTGLDATGKLGVGLQKLNINPKTGDLFIPQAATPQEQLFAKVVNDFTVKAKDSFGARVTNFELDRFMQRLPTLANSSEGRKLILSHMKSVSKAQQLEQKALQEVFDEYGVRNIDYAEAENIARKKIQPELLKIRQEALNLESKSRELENNQINAAKTNVLPGYVLMKKPDGTLKQFPEKNITNLEEKGYKRI